MTESQPQSFRTCHYFVDEAGDGTLFNKRKQTVVAREGCSRCFILGVLEVVDPVRLDEELESLRSNLRADPYLAKVPSMQPERRKTALAFHAKDDCAEVRREVYRVLMVHDVDDTREKEYGAYYTKNNPLTLEECKKIEPGI